MESPFLRVGFGATFLLSTSAASASSKVHANFAETVAQRQRAKSASGAMTWPTTAVRCPKHAAFTTPATLLAADAASSCSAAETSLRSLLGDATACASVEQPESYVPAHTPAEVTDATTATIEFLIGLAGEVLSHHAAPDGLLPADFVPTLPLGAVESAAVPSTPRRPTRMQYTHKPSRR